MKDAKKSGRLAGVRKEHRSGKIQGAQWKTCYLLAKSEWFVKWNKNPMKTQISSFQQMKLTSKKVAYIDQSRMMHVPVTVIRRWNYSTLQGQGQCLNPNGPSVRQVYSFRNLRYSYQKQKGGSWAATKSIPHVRMCVCVSVCNDPHPTWSLYIQLIMLLWWDKVKGNPELWCCFKQVRCSFWITSTFPPEQNTIKIRIFLAHSLP